MDIELMIKELELNPHPEGGFYKELYRSAEVIAKDALPERFTGDRNVSTAIYYALRKGDFSAFHRIKSDEAWHHYVGATLHVHVIAPDGTYELVKVGKDFAAGERPYAMIPAGHYFASHIVTNHDSDFALLGCTVAPGFDFEDFELTSRSELLDMFPQHQELIERLTR